MSTDVTLRFLEDDAEIRKINQLNNAPIKKDIIGEWILVSSIDTQTYLKKKSLGSFFNTLFLSTNQRFDVVDRDVTQTQLIGDKVVSEHTSRIGFETRRQQYRCKTTVQLNGSTLKTQETIFLSDGMGKTYDIELRYIDNGQLHIVNIVNQKVINTWSTVRCERIYEKVNREETMSETIREEIEGEWRPIGMRGAFHECCKAMNVSEQEKKVLKKGRISFKVLKFFNEVLSTQFTCEEHQITKSHKLDEVICGSLTFFFNNQLITEGQGLEIKRFVKNGTLFITYSKEGKSFMTVYKRV